MELQLQAETRVRSMKLIKKSPVCPVSPGVEKS